MVRTIMTWKEMVTVLQRCWCMCFLQTRRTSSRNNGKITICFHSITEISFRGCKMFPLQGHNIFSYGSPHTHTHIPAHINESCIYIFTTHQKTTNINFWSTRDTLIYGDSRIHLPRYPRSNNGHTGENVP